MKAAVFHHPKKITSDTIPDPVIEQSSDIILKVTSTAICGSDLHIYNVFIPQARNMVMGHEFMGIVQETGKSVKNLKVGDRVVVPFPIACEDCFFCDIQNFPNCEHSNPNYGPQGGLLKQKGGALFGYTDLYGGYKGGQAQYVRVPYADVSPRKISDNLKDEQALFLTDIFPTGWSAIDWAQLKGGETVVVFGCGPVGIMAMKSAWIKGAGRVIGVDMLDYRLDKARVAAKAETINFKDVDAIKAIRDMTHGRGADVCVDAVGMESDRSAWQKLTNIFHMQVGSINSLHMCIDAVRRGGTVSIVGVYGMAYDNFPIGQLFDKGITLKMGQAPVQKYIDELIELVETRKVILDDILTHTMPLDKVCEAYDMFCKKKDNCVKVILKP